VRRGYRVLSRICGRLPRDRWGRNDPLIWPAAAEFVKKLVPTADLRYFDGGHFVLDECADAIGEAIIETFSQ